MDFNNISPYPTDPSEGEDVLLGASSIDRRLANILNSLSQHAHQSNQSLLFQQAMPYDNGTKQTVEPDLPIERELTTVDTTALSLSFDEPKIHLAKEKELTPVGTEESVPLSLPSSFGRKQGNEGSFIVPPNIMPSLLDSNPDNVLLALANSAGLIPRSTSTVTESVTPDSNIVGHSSSPVFHVATAQIASLNDGQNSVHQVVTSTGLEGNGEGSSSNQSQEAKECKSTVISVIQDSVSTSAFKTDGTETSAEFCSSHKGPLSVITVGAKPVTPSFVSSAARTEKNRVTMTQDVSPQKPGTNNQYSMVDVPVTVDNMKEEKVLDRSQIDDLGDEMDKDEGSEALVPTHNGDGSHDKNGVVYEATNDDCILLENTQKESKDASQQTFCQKHINLEPNYRVDLTKPISDKDVPKPENSTSKVDGDRYQTLSQEGASQDTTSQSLLSDPSISEMQKQESKRSVKTRITLTGKQLASLLDKSSGKKVLHIIPQKSSSGKLSSIKTDLTGSASMLEKQQGAPGKHVKVIQLKPSQIQQVKPGVYSFKLPQESSSVTRKSSGKIDNLGYTLMQSKLAKSSPTFVTTKNRIESEKVGTLASRGQFSNDGLPSMCNQDDIHVYSQIKSADIRKEHGAGTTNDSSDVIDLTCTEADSFSMKKNIFDKFMGPDDSDNSSQDSQLDETTLIQNSLSSAVHRSKATRTVLQNASTREKLYKDIQQHLRHHVSEKPAGGIETYEISDSDSSDSSNTSLDRSGINFNRRGVGIRGKSYGEPLRKVVIDRSQYNKLAQVGRNVILGMGAPMKKKIVPGSMQLIKRKRGRPRKDELTKSTSVMYDVKKLQVKKAKKHKQKENFSSRFEKTELPEHLLKSKNRKTNTQENIIDLTKKQGNVILSETSFELDEEIHEKVAQNLKRKGWICTLCGKTCNVGLLDTLFGPYKVRVAAESIENTKTDTEMLDISEKDESSAYMEVWLHRDCVVWTPNVCLVGPQLKGIGSALEEAGHIKCSLCAQFGASLACMSRLCGERYHFICAKQTGCLFKEENFSILCCKHKYPVTN